MPTAILAKPIRQNHPISGIEQYLAPLSLTGQVPLGVLKLAAPADIGGHHLFVYEDGDAPLIFDGVLLGAVDGSMRSAARDYMQTNLGVRPTAPIVNQAIGQLYFEFPDNTGALRWKGMRGDTRTAPAIRIGHRFNSRFGALYSDTFTEGSLSWGNRLVIFRLNYVRYREAGVPLDLLRRRTGAEMFHFFGRASDSLAADLLPDPYKSDGWLPRETVVTEDFSGDLTNWTTAGTWAIVTGHLEMTASLGNSRAGILHNTSLSDDGFFHEADFWSPDPADPTGLTAGIMVRMGDLGENTTNGNLMRVLDSFTHEIGISSVTDDSQGVALDTLSQNWVDGETMKLDVNAADALEGFIEGVSVLGPNTSTDWAGVFGFGMWVIGSATSDWQWDNVTADDGAAPSGRIMGALAGQGGLADKGGLAGKRGGLAA